MSRGEDVRVGSRQNADRYLQLAEPVRVNKAGRKKSFSERKTQSQKVRSNGVGVSKQLSLQDFVKVSGYASNMEQLVFRVEESEFAGKIPRSKIAEVFALSNYQTMSVTAAKDKKEKKGWAENVGVDGGAGHQHRSVPESTVREPATNNLYCVGASANVDLVHAAILNFKSLRKSDCRSLDTLDQDDMASARGQNVSILHLRGPSDPWDPPITTFADAGGSLRSAPKMSLRNSCATYQNDLDTKMTGSLSMNNRKHDSNSVSLFVASGVNHPVNVNSANRELSPVRWCDREVDGVYLGRSGWVQVQQRSLDESKNCKPIAATLPNRIKLSQYHYNSEPGEHNDVRKDRPRPDFLPLPLDGSRARVGQKTPSPLLQEYDSLSPPSTTPIISPPPAFQDQGLESNYKTRNLSGKPPFLARSKAIVDCESPPDSSPNKWNSWRFKKLTPSPASSQQHILLNSQTKSLEDNKPYGTRRNEFQRFAESSTSSLSSSFGFSSLDGSVGRNPALPRLNKVDSSVDCDEEEGGDDYHRSRARMISPPPDSYHNGERVSPNTFRRRGSQRGHRTPSSKINGKKQRSSSSSDSCSSCERKSPSTNYRRLTHRQSRGDIQSNPWDVRNSRVRRSRSLQLPEKRSSSVPGAATPSSSRSSKEYLSPDYPLHSNFKNGGTNSNHSSSYRVVVKVNGEAVNMPDRPRRFSQKKAHSEDANYDELKREAEEETRIVTEYLKTTRSRAAARDLLMHRYLNRSEELKSSRGSPVSTEISADPLYNVYFSGSYRTAQKKPPLQRNGSQVYVANSPTNPPNPCSQSTCDFWPHCAQREIITYPKPAPGTKLSPPNMKSSHSYPASQTQRKAEKSRKEEKPENRSSSTRSSPSVEFTNDFDVRKDGRKSGGSIKSSPYSRRCQKLQRQTVEKVRGTSRKGKFVADREGSSPCSSSSEISDRVAKTVKNLKSSDSLDGCESVESRSSSRDRRNGRTLSPRPGSAPTNETYEELTALDAQRRSLSLPKSFLSNGYKSTKQSGLFPWKRQFIGTNSSSGLRPSTPEMSKTAPATPVRDLGSGNKEKERVKQTQYVRSSSTPLLDEPPNVNSDWRLRRDIPQGTEESTKEINSRINQKELLGQRNILGNQTSESVLQKFKKSFSLRFQKPALKGSSKDGIEDADDLTEDGNEEEPPPPPAPALEPKNNPQTEKEESTYDQKFRFGPLVWRSSKERKKGKKAVRSAKCNSGDSGIQIESSLYLPGDSSESHDTDQHDELDSPPVIRRRTASAEKSSRPQSEVINQILIDKFKADLQWRAQTKGYPNRRVRRTNSDLGGQRLFNWELRNNYRRMMSVPSPVKGRPSRTTGSKLTPEGIVGPRRRVPGRGQLRRSMSQPLGLNELSPLMRRKPSVVRNQILSEDEHDARGATSDDEALSDSESSVTSVSDRKKSFEAAMDEEVVVLAEAVWDHVAMEPEELAFRAGDVIEVLDTLDRDWWWGATGNNYGWFPSAFVRLRVSQEDTVEDCLEAMASGNQTTKQIRRRTSISLLSNDQVRSSVVRELLNTERDFVKVLRDVTEGYIAECRRRTDMFTATQIETIFGNMEDLLAFQTQFLEDLEVRVDRETPHRSCVGEIFLKHRAGFRMYSEYCNSHPMAIATLQELYQRNSYSKFFEACRLMRGLIEIPLDGYLLTPVQRICKYPLQLAELLKYTKPEHPDHHKVKEALETMRDVAVLINERKRRMESLEKLAAWQQRVEGWEGEELIEVSTQLIHQGEAVRVTSGMWTSNITIFLFDHQLVYCKKDLLKRNTYVYKGRICMDTSEVIDIPDGKDPQSNVTIRHGIKIYSCIRDKWLLFCCRNAEEKSKWLEALSEERKLVAQDRQNDMELPAAARQLARMAARSKRRPPNEPRSKTYKRETSHYNGYKVGRKVGTWFTFGGAKKSSRMNLRTRNAPQHVM